MIFLELALSLSMKKLLHTIEKLLGIYRWHPTIALRYLPIVDEIKSLSLENSDILEVGSGGLGITPYIRKKVIGIDVEFSPPIHENLIPVKASAIRIPFKDDAFDVVISIDMLEHIEENYRRQAIFELLRVTRKLLCIAVPCGQLSQKQDSELASVYKKLLKKEFNFFAEHETLGLPDKDWIVSVIHEESQKLQKQIKLKTNGFLNLGLRYFLMRGWISNNPFVNVIFRKVLLIFIPLMRRYNHEPTYRQHFFVTIG